MQLRYHKGNNFGDALNPIIWQHFLPDFFNNDDSELFIGFGTLLGFDFPKNSRKIVFSTGATIDNNNYYGSLPMFDSTWDIKCVRGPLTAKLLKIDRKLAVADGAILIKELSLPKVTNSYDCSFIPHVGSLEFFDIKRLCEENGIKFIDPRQDPWVIIKEIIASKKIITEAMHGAIVADALRVPWIPLKIFRQVNEYKWNDWLLSMSMEKVNFSHLPELFDLSYVEKIIKNKLRVRFHAFNKTMASLYCVFQSTYYKKKAIKKFNVLKNSEGFLSDNSILQNKTEKLKELICSLKKEHKK